MSGFDSFRRSSSAKLAEAMKKSQEPKNYDDGSWKLEADKETGLGSAVIRFLPPKVEGDLPYISYSSHFFKGDDGRWCIVDRCPRSFGWDHRCPICDMNHELWESGIKENQEKARSRKAKKTYAFQIYIVKDPANPENEGKVKVFKCGPSIFKMVMDSMTSQFGEEPKKPFDIYEGNNFMLRVYKDSDKKGLAQYDKSIFDNNFTALAANDAELEKIYNEMIDLKEFLHNGKILTEDELDNLATKAYQNSIANSSTFSRATASASASTSAPRASTNTAPAKEIPQEVAPLPFDIGETVAPSESSNDMEFWESLANKI